MSGYIAIENVEVGDKLKFVEDKGNMPHWNLKPGDTFKVTEKGNFQVKGVFDSGGLTDWVDLDIRKCIKVEEKLARKSKVTIETDAETAALIYMWSGMSNGYSKSKTELYDNLNQLLGDYHEPPHIDWVLNLYDNKEAISEWVGRFLQEESPEKQELKAKLEEHKRTLKELEDKLNSME